MNWKVVVVSLGLAALLAGPASALTLMNEDVAPYEVVVLTGQGDAEVETITLEGGDSLDDICPEGCVLQLPSGLSQTFAGHEEVSIVDGEFVIAE